MLHPKKVGTLPVAGSDEEKQTNEIKTAIPLLDAVEITDKTVSADALLTQRELASYLVDQRHAHYHFTVKGNQKNLLEAIQFYFDHQNRPPDHATLDGIEHGRIEQRHIWTTTELNDYLDFPHVQQAFMVERVTTHKKSGKRSREVAYGITSKTPDQASAAQVLQDNRQHWRIESHHYMIDWNYDEDRSRIRKGYGPENMTRLRRFAIGLIKSKGVRCTVAQKMQELMLNTRAVFDYLKMTENTAPRLAS